MVQLQPNVDGSNYRNFEEDLGHWYAGARFSDVDKEQMKKHWKRVEVVAVHIERSQQLMNIVYNEWRQKKEEALRRELELLNTTGDAEQQLDIVNIEQQQAAE
ncbi:hypothetical protein ABBQ32_004177 [Trebouxia sp. C0010 RCD-2024]